MSSQPQQSLRKHRQTLIPGAVPASTKKSYGQLDTVKAQLPSVASKDREKVGNMVKKRFSSRVQADNIYKLDEVVPPLPSNAWSKIEERALPREKSDLNQPEVGTPYKQTEKHEDRYHSQSASVNSSSGTIRAELPPEKKSVRHEVDRYGHGQKKSEQNQAHSEPFSKGIDPLQNKSFDAKSFISEQLSSATDKEISAFAEDLHNKQEQLKIDRKEALYQNYKTFLSVGSQISKFGTETELLRKLVGDLKEAMTAMIDDAELAVAYSNGNQTGSKSDLRRTGSRNSVIMLEKMWADELGSLFRHVEGAQQYLPVIPGRHVVTESGGWYQLNSATWQPIQPIHIFLLNDHLLIATKKRTRAKRNDNVQADKRLVADNCWPLEDISLIDISKADELDAAMAKYTKLTICVKTGNSAYVYRAEKAEGHRRLMTEFAQTKAEFTKLQSGKSSRTHSRNASGSGDFSRSSTSRSVNEMTEEKINDVGTTLQDLKEVDNVISELDIGITYRKFDEAVSLIEESLKGLQKESRYHVKGKSASGDIIVPSEMFKSKLDQRVAELSSLLLTELSQDYLSRNQIQSTVKLLIRLNAQERAKKTFLKSRKSQLQRRIKQVEFQGDIVNYIRQIVIIYFRMISSCVEIFLSCFDHHEHASSVVQWATEQIDAYGILFSRQLYNIAPTSPTYQKCVEITKNQMSQLERFGLDFGFRLKFIYENGAAA